MIRKPFWQGKTCEQLEDTRVKVTFHNGTTLTGTLAKGRFIKFRRGLCNAWTPFVTHDGRIDALRDIVATVEPDTEPGYEPVEPDGTFYGGDLAVLPSGNRYPVIGIRSDGDDTLIRLAVPDADGCDDLNFLVPLERIGRIQRRKTPRMPDRPGLWRDKDGNMYAVGGNMRMMRIHTKDGWTSDAIPLGLEAWRDSAPFTLWKGDDQR